MPAKHYLWRTLTPQERTDLLTWRQSHNRPHHSPPHKHAYTTHQFHITAACFNHAPHIGLSPDRMQSFSTDLLSLLQSHTEKIHAWCVLPNHYHALIKTPNLAPLLHAIGQFHGKTSHAWNTHENTRGRKVFFRCTDRAMRSDRHFWSTMNYLHHNPVHHKYTTRWQDWPWSSAPDFLAQYTPEQAQQIWKQYPLKDYGQSWDPPAL